MGTPPPEIFSPSVCKFRPPLKGEVTSARPSPAHRRATLMAKVILQDVVKAYGNVYAVNHVSLTVEDGEFVALVGPSGCGKTTTLNLIAGLIPMSGGDIYISDKL